jgi:uncharacterized protein (DUF58 family)
VLTRTGLGVLIGAAVCAFFGLLWRYEELLTLAAAGAIAVAFALYTSHRPTRHSARRRLITARVARGDVVHVRYQIFNQTQHRLGSTRLTDEFQGVHQSFEVPTLPRMTRHEVEAHFDTRRRGIFPIGPLSFERTDQLGLAAASRPLGQMGMVVVHPRVYPLITASGAVRVITNDAVLRRPSGDPQSGFQSLREYQYGDDTRLIHWPTSARAATLMIREFVDLRRHEFTVVIDTSTEVATPDDFEEIVDAGASVAAFALRSGLDVVVRSTSRVRAGRPYALVDQSEMLDLLTPLEQGSGTDVLSVASLFTGGLGGVAVLVVTGPKGPSSIFSHGDQISVARVGIGAETAGLSCPAIAAQDAGQFAERWAQWN